MRNYPIFFLAIILILSACFVEADNKAETPSGYGTKSNPYKINKVENLVWLSQNALLLSELTYISLEKNIDASETKDWNNGEGFIPIGISDNPNYPINVCVDFNGKGHTIFGLNIDCPSGKFLGLFSSLRGSKIYDLVISNSYFSGYRQMGAISGNAESSFFERCSVVDSSLICSVTNISGFGTHVWIGGLVGYSVKSNTFNRCEFSGELSGDYAIGGIAGNAKNTKVTDSVSKADLIDIGADALAIGGIIGNAVDSKILRCVSEINCFNNTNGYGIGGVAGFAGINETEIKCSCAKGKISGNYSIGGIVGDGGGLIENCYSRCELRGNREIGGIIGTVASFCTISNCYSLGEISADYDAGGIVGNDYYQSEITDCFHSLRPLSGWESSREEMKNRNTYSGWDFDKIWNINDGFGYPYFEWEIPEPMFAFTVLSFLFMGMYVSRR